MPVSLAFSAGFALVAIGALRISGYFPRVAWVPLQIDLFLILWGFHTIGVWLDYTIDDPLVVATLSTPVGETFLGYLWCLALVMLGAAAWRALGSPRSWSSLENPTPAAPVRFQRGLLAMLIACLAYTFVGWLMPHPLKASRIISPRTLHPEPAAFLLLMEFLLLVLLAGLVWLVSRRAFSRTPAQLALVGLLPLVLGAGLALAPWALPISVVPGLCALGYGIFLLIASERPWREARPRDTRSALRKRAGEVAYLFLAGVLVLIAAAPGWFLFEFNVDASQLTIGFTETTFQGGFNLIISTIVASALSTRLGALAERSHATEPPAHSVSAES